MRLRVAALLASAAQIAGAQITVSGVVRDSLAQTPLAGAAVQLVAVGGGQSGRAATSDSAGRFEFTRVPDGAYRIGFFHALLDSLGVEPSSRTITVANGQPLHVDLATPSARQLRTAYCGEHASTDSGGVVIGVVRDATNAQSVAQASVVADWFEYIVAQNNIAQRVRQIDTTSRANGWYAVCGVPHPSTISLRAAHGFETTDQIEIDVPASGFVRRDLYVGGASGGRLTGTVLATEGARPISGAQIAAATGASARANGRGEWTLGDLPLGTRSFEVRAVGYYPERIAVDVTLQPEPVRMALRTMRSVLDTVKIVEARTNTRNLAAFDQRRRSGAGRYITMADVLRRDPIVTSDLFRTMPGLRLDGFGGVKQLSMRGTFSDRCAPTVFIDGLPMLGGGVDATNGYLNPDDLDAFVNPDEIAGIEIYTATTLPAQFRSSALAGADTDACGAILVWTRTPMRQRERWTKGAAVRAAGFVALIVGVSLYLTHR